MSVTFPHPTVSVVAFEKTNHYAFILPTFHGFVFSMSTKTYARMSADLAPWDSILFKFEERSDGQVIWLNISDGTWGRWYTTPYEDESTGEIFNGKTLDIKKETREEWIARVESVFKGIKYN